MAKEGKSGFETLARESSLYPQEQLLAVKKSNKGLCIGVPNEVSLQEQRVPLTPGAVELLVSNGHEVAIESGTGESARYTDKEYSDVGAKIVYSAKEAFECPIVLKIEPPTKEEVALIKPNSFLISALQLGSQTPDYFNELCKRRINAIGFELIEDKVGSMPVVRAMSEIAGSTVIMIASEYLGSARDGKGVLLGGITGVVPAKVVILGAGTVGEYAARAAMGLGASVEIYDNHIYKLRRIKQALGGQVPTSAIDSVMLLHSLKQADVLIGAVRPEKGRSRCIVTEEMVMQMKPGAVIIDVSIDQGGCIETSEMTTHHHPTFEMHEVIHYCVPNIASRVSRTASMAVSNILTPMLLQAGDAGGIEEMIFSSKGFMKGVYVYRASLTHEHIARKFGLKYKDLHLLMAARF